MSTMVAAEHILLTIVDETSPSRILDLRNRAFQLVKMLGGDPKAIRRDLWKAMGDCLLSDEEPWLDYNALQALSMAKNVATRCGTREIGAEHLLAGLANGTSRAATILAQHLGGVHCLESLVHALAMLSAEYQDANALPMVTDECLFEALRYTTSKNDAESIANATRELFQGNARRIAARLEVIQGLIDRSGNSETEQLRSLHEDLTFRFKMPRASDLSDIGLARSPQNRFAQLRPTHEVWNRLETEVDSILQDRCATEGITGALWARFQRPFEERPIVLAAAMGEPVATSLGACLGKACSLDLLRMGLKPESERLL